MSHFNRGWKPLPQPVNKFEQCFNLWVIKSIRNKFNFAKDHMLAQQPCIYARGRGFQPRLICYEKNVKHAIDNTKKDNHGNP
jgi:hypothetical protein